MATTSFSVCTVLVLLLWGTYVFGRGSVYLENNGYRNILITIGDQVQEDPKLIDMIKQLFTDASQFLYDATR